MTTVDCAAPVGEQPRSPGWLARWWANARTRGSSARKRALVAGAKAYVRAMRDRFGLAQLAGGAAASAGTFELWGVGVGLLVTGLSVVVAATVIERQC